MKKNVSRTTVTKALTLGMSAVIATAQPVSVLASELNEVPAIPVDALETADSEEGVADAAQVEATAVEATFEETSETVGAIAGASAIFTYESAEAGVNADNKDNAAAVANALEAVEKDASIAEAEQEIENIDNALNVLEQIDKREIAVSSELADTVKDVTETAEQIAEEVFENSEKVTNLAETVINASSIEVAREAYEELNALANKTADDVDAAAKTLEELNAKYDDAVKQLDAAQAAYNSMQNTASADAVDAKNAVDVAAGKVDALAIAVGAAQTGVEKTQKAALDIIKAQEKVNETNKDSINWNQTAALYSSLMKNYYVPALFEGAKDIKVESKFVKCEGNGDDDYNYNVVTFTDSNGVKQTKYFNYKMESGSNTNIVIFEKSEEEIKAANAVNEYAKTVNKGIRPEIYEAGAIKYTENGQTVYKAAAELPRMVETGTVVEVDGVYYLKNEATGEPDIKIENVAAPSSKEGIAFNATQNAVTIDETSKKTAFEIRDGVLTLVTTGDVTTDIYKHLKTDVSEYKNEYTEAEKQALIDALGSNVEFAEVLSETEKNPDGTPKTYYLLKNISYIPTFTASGLDVNRRTNNKNGHKNAIGEVISDIESSQHIKVLSYDLSAEGDGTWINAGDEDYQVQGSVTVIINNVKVTLPDFTGAFANEAAARAALEAKVLEYLKNDGQTVDCIKVNDEYPGGITHVFNAGDVKETKIYTTTEGFTDLKYNTKTYEKIACYVDYLQLIDSSIANGEELSTQEYKNAVEIVNILTKQNAEYLAYLKGENDDIFVESTNEGLKNLLSNAKALAEKYESIASQAEAAQQAIAKTTGEITKLQGAITELKRENEHTASQVFGVSDIASYLTKNFNIELTEEEAAAITDDTTISDIIKLLDDKRKAASDKLDDAKKALETVKSQQTKAAGDLQNTISRLTPAPAPAVNAPAAINSAPSPVSDDNDSYEYESNDETPAPAVNNAPAANANANNAPAPMVINGNPTPLAGGNAANNGGNVANDGNNGNVVINDNQTPLAGGSTTNNGTVTIEGNQTPLAGSLINEMKPLKTPFSWWWLLLAAVISSTGYVAYKSSENQKKETSDK